MYFVIQEMKVATAAINKGINQPSSQAANFLFLQHLLFVSQNVILREQVPAANTQHKDCPRTSISTPSGNCKLCFRCN